MLSIPGILLGLKDELGDTLALGAANETEQDEEILNILTSLPLWNW